MSNTKLFLVIALLAATFGMWYWGRQSNRPPGATEKPAVPPGTLERTGADPFPAEPKK